MTISIKYICLFLLSSFIFSATFTDQIQNNEQNIYYTYGNEQVLITTEQINIITHNEEAIHEIQLTGSDGGSATIHLKAISLLPVSVNYYDKNGGLTKQLIYGDEKIFVKLNNGIDQYEYPTNKKDFYDMNSFFHLMRGFPLDKNEVTFWSFLPEIRRGFLLYAKNLGEDVLTKNNQEIACYKIEVGSAGLIESTIFPQKFYFWITSDRSKRFVQFEGKDFFGRQQRTEVQ